MKKYEYKAFSANFYEVQKTIDKYSEDGWRIIQSQVKDERTMDGVSYTRCYIIMEREKIDKDENYTDTNNFQ